MDSPSASYPKAVRCKTFQKIEIITIIALSKYQTNYANTEDEEAMFLKNLMFKFMKTKI